ncbi:MAG: sugar diacid recognition domain-containing protein, partial [Eubacteriales bacterium]
MIIPKKQMQKIVEEVGATIHKNVNIMDETGCIIASTDSERIGLLHSGAVELLENNLASIVIEKDSIGSKSGINLPLVIENKVIGVVGITGAVEEVGVLGTVIKKMTEILVWDWYTRNQKNAIETFKR